MFDTILTPTVSLYLKISALYFSSVLINLIILRKPLNKPKTAISLIILSASLSAIYIQANSEPTKYTDFGVYRHAKTHEIKSRYRAVSKQAHPDLSQEEREMSFEELSDKLEFLVDKTKREFYDKYDRIYENKDIDVKELKQIQSYLFQFEFYRLVNISFVWICMLFLLSTLTRSQKLINMMLKFVVLKTFIQVFYIYTQPVEEKSVFDSLFPYLTIHLQVRYIEYFFAVVMGFVWNVLYCRYRDRLGENRELIGCLQKEVEGVKGGCEEACEKLGLELEKVREVVNY